MVNDGFRWARVQVNIHGGVSREHLIKAKQAQQGIVGFKSRVILQDYSEAGDRIEKSD